VVVGPRGGLGYPEIADVETELVERGRRHDVFGDRLGQHPAATRVLENLEHPRQRIEDPQTLDARECVGVAFDREVEAAASGVEHLADPVGDQTDRGRKGDVNGYLADLRDVGADQRLARQEEL
jgi:hypothetical protein